MGPTPHTTHPMTYWRTLLLGYVGKPLPPETGVPAGGGAVDQLR